VTTDAAPDPFAPQIEAAVVAHMNGDHVEDNLLIVRSLGGLPDATEARMTGISPAGAAFEGVVAGTAQAVTVPWSSPIADRGAIRVEVVRMYHEACAALGVAPREAGEH
jgi:putative heme iron utilization protein